MQLGFVSAILPDQTLDQVFSIASSIGYDCVEVMCWPIGKATRRYAGVTHLDVTDFKQEDVSQISHLTEKHGISISALGYYPNPLIDDAKESQVYIDHIKKIITAASMLNINSVTSFIGKDHTKSVDDNWPRFLEVWSNIISFAETHAVKIAIENCPMFFTRDEWPGGKNLATSPSIWSRMFASIQSDFFGLNYDPSHMILQHMDYLEPIRNFTDKLFHVHAKDVQIDTHRLNKVGILAPPNEWHTPRLPGLGEVDWGQFFATLANKGYTGPICVEVEDRDFEGDLDMRISALKQSYTYLKQFV